MPKFTKSFLESLKASEGRQNSLVFDQICPGLGVRVAATGARVFIVQWTDPINRRRMRQRVGTWGNITIKQAREAAQGLLGDVAKGINPKAERQRLRAEAERQCAEKAFTFNVLVDEWAELHLAHRRERYRTEAVRAIRHAFPSLLTRPAGAITKADAVRLLDKLLRARKLAMAGRSAAYARAAFRWAQKRGKVATNPFECLPLSGGTPARERVLNDTELATVWAASGTLGYPWGPFFQLALLTLQRREEVAGIRWSELADDLTTWTLPGSRMKNGRAHEVHLSACARAILRGLPRVDDCDLVFSTTGRTPVSGFSKAKRALDTAIMKVRRDAAIRTNERPRPLVDWRLHDFRRTGVSVLARLGFDSIIADKLLAHQPTKWRGATGVYQRYDFARERAAALDRWAAYVLKVAASNASQLSMGLSGPLERDPAAAPEIPASLPVITRQGREGSPNCD